MKLNHTISGPEQGLPVLLVHGLFGQARNLGAQARRLAQTRRVVSVDLRNHGDSPHDPDASYAAMAADLARLIED
ncbi:MAG: alpha/beta fold hydrolase, partial [Thermaurantiacus sp.]